MYCGVIGVITSLFTRRFVWNFFRLEAEHLSNVGEFRAVRDISLRPIKRQPKEKDEDGDVLSPPPTNLKQGASLQEVHAASSQILHRTTSIRSSDISSIQSPELQHLAAGSCNFVGENKYSATSSPAAESNKLELLTPNQQVVQADVMDTIAETSV